MALPFVYVSRFPLLQTFGFSSQEFLVDLLINHTEAASQKQVSLVVWFFLMHVLNGSLFSHSKKRKHERSGSNPVRILCESALTSTRKGHHTRVTAVHWKD